MNITKIEMAYCEYKTKRFRKTFKRKVKVKLVQYICAKEIKGEFVDRMVTEEVVVF